MKKMLLIDGNSMLFRAYFATAYGRMMTNSNGVATNAVYGLNMMINKAIDLVQPDYIFVAFDAGKKTFRHDMYPEYKGGRNQTPDELIVQFPIARELLSAMGISYYEEQQMEADDIIGSTAKKYNDTVHINILSSDKDLLQLIDTNTSVWLMRKGLTEIEEMTIESLKSSKGIRPDQIIDLKGLMGDASDNIPGIKGVGEKTALQLLAQYDNVENVIEHTGELKGKLKEKVEAGKESALLSKKLATIVTDMDIEIPLAEMERHKNPEALYEFYKKYDMKSLMGTVIFDEKEEASNEEIKEEAKGTYKVVEKLSDKFLTDEASFIVDYDFDDYTYATIYGFALGKGNEAEYIYYDDALEDMRFVQWLKEDNHKLLYDAKRVLHLFKHNRLEISRSYEDIKIMAFLIDNFVDDYNKLSQKYHLLTGDLRESIYGKAGKAKEPDEEKQTEFASLEALDVAGLYLMLKEEIDKLEMEPLYREIELPLTYILYDMELQGIKVDQSVLDEIADKTAEKLEELKENIYFYAMHEFNINSTQQLAVVLFDELGLPANKKRSTAIDVLEKLKGKHPIIDELIEYRKYAKLYSTYAEGLKKYIKKDGRIHTSFDQCGTQTGRLSSNDPNLQNISVRSEEGREIRKAFVPEEQSKLVSCDYSQVELRVLAHMANEEALIEAFKEGMDIHTKTAMDIFKVGKDEVTSLMRRQAKAINFGIVYGMSGFGLADQIGVSNYEATQFINTYFASYPQIKEFMNRTVESCKEKGYVTTLWNRRRYIPEIRDSNRMMREFGKRAAMNAPIQGSAADLIKIAMIRIFERLEKEGCESKIIVQIHDEVLLNVPLREYEQVCHIIKEEMENAMELKVPLVSNLVSGDSWYEAK